MGAVKFWDIFCDSDDCGMWDPNATAKTAKLARRLAYRLGWRRRRETPDGPLRDFALNA